MCIHAWRVVVAGRSADEVAIDDGTDEIFESRALPDERCLSLLCEESRAVDAFSAKGGDDERRCMSSRLRRRVARIAAAGNDAHGR